MLQKAVVGTVERENGPGAGNGLLSLSPLDVEYQKLCLACIRVHRSIEIDHLIDLNIQKLAKLIFKMSLNI